MIKKSCLQTEMELEKHKCNFMSSLGTVNVTEEQRQSERDLLFDKTIENILLKRNLNNLVSMSVIKNLGI